MSFFLGFADYDDVDTGVGIWEDILQVEARRFFRKKSYGAGVHEVAIQWSAFPGPSQTRIRGPQLILRPKIARRRILRSVEPRARLDYLVEVTLERVREHSAYLVKKGFDASRFLSDLTHFFRVHIPKRIAGAPSEVDPDSDQSAEIDRIVALMEAGRPVERVDRPVVLARSKRRKRL